MEVAPEKPIESFDGWEEFRNGTSTLWTFSLLVVSSLI
jgi:hypothetical protein